MYFIDIHTHKSKNASNTLEIISIGGGESSFLPEKNLLYSIGIHPWHLEKSTLFSEIEDLKSKLSLNEIIAIGECGLDRFSFKNENELALQLTAFNLQADLAQTYNKPMIIHSVNSYSDFLHWLKMGKYDVKLIFHGFNGNIDIASKLIKHSCWLSFGESLINSKKVRTVFKHIPLEKCFLETDESNIPIEEIYEEAAKLKNISKEQLMNQINNNFNQIFKNVR